MVIPTLSRKIDSTIQNTNEILCIFLIISAQNCTLFLTLLSNLLLEELLTHKNL
jgi:hypothetical protein